MPGRAKRDEDADDSAQDEDDTSDDDDDDDDDDEDEDDESEESDEDEDDEDDEDDAASGDDADVGLRQQELVLRDVEGMRAICADMGVIKARLEARMASVREARDVMMRQEAEERRKAEEHRKAEERHEAEERRQAEERREIEERREAEERRVANQQREAKQQREAEQRHKVDQQREAELRRKEEQRQDEIQQQEVGQRQEEGQRREIEELELLKQQQVLVEAARDGAAIALNAKAPSTNDAMAQTDWDMATINQMEMALLQPPSLTEEYAAKPRLSSSLKRDASRTPQPPALSMSPRVQAWSALTVDRSASQSMEPSPGLSLLDLTKSVGPESKKSGSLVDAFGDELIKSIAASKRLEPIASADSSFHPPIPDDQSWNSQSTLQAKDSLVMSKSAGSHPAVAHPSTSRAVKRSNPANQEDDRLHQHSVPAQDILQHSFQTSLFDAQDSLGQGSSRAASLAGKTDEQREMEAIQSLLFGR